jgi:hypothetical protein
MVEAIDEQAVMIGERDARIAELESLWVVKLWRLITKR